MEDAQASSQPRPVTPRSLRRTSLIREWDGMENQKGRQIEYKVVVLLVVKAKLQTIFLKSATVVKSLIPIGWK